MALSKKQIAVILAMKNKKAGTPAPQKSPMSPAVNVPPGFAPIPSNPIKAIPSVSAPKSIGIPKPPSAPKFPKLRLKIAKLR